MTEGVKILGLYADIRSEAPVVIDRDKGTLQ
jgi:hypothetical protein